MSRFSVAVLLCGVSSFALCASAASASGIPSGGHYVSGKGEIGRAGQSVTVKQSSTTGIIDWNRFSIGSKSSVQFDNGSGATLNRVTGGNLSTIAGSLHATGSLYLMNSSGVIVSGTGRVVTGGSFVASAGDISNSAFNADQRRFSTARARIVNRGSIVAGGEVKFSGSSVSNAGTITAAVANLHADNGEALDAGTIHATGSAHRNAEILVISRTGDTKIAGHLVAIDRDGSGGHIETSGRSISLQGSMDAGKGGTWLVDPENLTVDAAAAATINYALNAKTNVELESKANGTVGPGNSSTGAGDILIEAALSWNTNAELTLDSYHGIIVQSSIDVTGSGKVTLDTRNGGSLNFNSGNIAFTGTDGQLVIDRTKYKLVKNLTALASDIETDPSGKFALAENYDAKADGTYSSSPIGTTFTGDFEGLGNSVSNLNINDSAPGSSLGLFSTIGAGGSVENLQLLNATVVSANVSVVGALVGSNDGTIANVLTSGSLSADSLTNLGGLVGLNDGTIQQSRSSASVSDATGTVGGPAAGGLVGFNYGTIDGSSASGNVVVGFTNGGGLAGENLGTITYSYATGNVTGGDRADVGGLVGASGGTIGYSWASGSVVGGGAANVGGLAGMDDGAIANSYATGNVSGGIGDGSGYGSGIGGLVGFAQGDEISTSYATGNVSGSTNAYLGGLAGFDKAATIDNTYASGDVLGAHSAEVGGLIGDTENSAFIAHSHATGDVKDEGQSTDDYTNVGGLIGLEDDSSTVSYSWASGRVVGSGGELVGGLVGQTDEQSSISNSHAQGTVRGRDGSVGGLVGFNSESKISKSYATGSVTGGQAGDDALNASAGGLVGWNYGSIDRSFATGSVAGYVGDVGGLIGYNNYTGSVTNSYATGVVATGYYVGGFVGFNYGDLSDDYSTGSVAGQNTVGGFAGINGASNADQVVDCYWDTTTSGSTKSNGPGIVGLTSEQLQAALPPGFKNSVWAISSAVNNGFPYLVALKNSY